MSEQTTTNKCNPPNSATCNAQESVQEGFEQRGSDPYKRAVELHETTLSICRLIVSVKDVLAFEVTPESDFLHAIAYVPCNLMRDEQEANARLIAAAPDLLEACTLALTRIAHTIQCATVNPSEQWESKGSISFDNCKCERAFIKAAIAKAEGKE